MQQIYPDNGLVYLLLTMCTSTIRFHLFANNVTPDKSSVIGTFTEPSTAGYLPVSVNQSAFTLTGVVAHVGVIQALPVSFTFSATGSETAYGYFVTDAVDSLLLACARFDTPIPITSASPILVTPVFSDFSLFP